MLVQLVRLQVTWQDQIRYTKSTTVAVRRRCSFGEITVDSPVEGSIVIEEKKDGFEMGDASLLPQNGSSQPIASKSLLGVNVAVNPNSRYRGKTGKNRELVCSPNRIY